MIATTKNFANAGMVICRNLSKLIKVSYMTESHTIRIFKNNALLECRAMGEYFREEDFDMWCIEQINKL